MQALTIIITSAAMSFYLMPKLSGVALIFTPVMLYVAFIEGRVLGAENLVEKESIEKSCNLAVEALNNIRTVASLGAEERFMELYHEELSESHRYEILLVLSKYFRIR